MNKIECKDEEELKTYKDKAMKAKLIALDRMDKHPLMNPRMFSKRERERLVEMMGEIFSTWETDKIDKEFADIVNERILANGLDYHTYPIYDLAKPKETEQQMDIGGNVVDVSITEH